MKNWPVRVLLLGQEGETPLFETCKVLSQLSLLWKFEYTALPYPKNTESDFVHSYTHAVITYATKDETYEKWVLEMVDFQKIDHVLLIDASPKSYGAMLSKRFGVQGIMGDVFSKKKAKLRRLSDDHILIDTERQMRFHGDASERFGTIKITQANLLIGNNDRDCFMSLLITDQIRNYCFSLPLWQFGVPTFPSFFYIFRNFLFL